MNYIPQKKFWFILAIMSGIFFLGSIILCIYIFSYTPDKSDVLVDTQDYIRPMNIDTISKKNEAIHIEKKKPVVRQATIHAVGDIMLDRTVYLHMRGADDFSFPFLRIEDFLLDADITVGNLEGSITDNTSISNGVGGQRFYFTFSSKTVAPLTRYFDVVSFANNHAYNFGKDGLMQSRAYLDESGLAYFGDPNNASGTISVVLKKNDITFGFVGFHELIGYGFPQVIKEVKRLRPQVDVLIAYPHWGHEYITTHPSSAQKKEAYALIDAGVDVIFGAHPHVIQPIEIYKDKVIFYSLGNFIFDQYFSTDTQQSLGIEMNVREEHDTFDFSYNIFPIHVSEKSQPYVADNEEATDILDTLSNNSIVTSSIQKQIREGYIFE